MFDTSIIYEANLKRLGMYFTTNKNYANCYGENVYSFNLDISNVFDLRIGSKNGYVNANEFVKLLPISKKLKNELSMGAGETLAYGLLEGALKENIIQELKGLGYDGIVFYEGYGETWIPFYNYQIELCEYGEFYHGTEETFI